ncbi:right-handed parallel beta-helix repeat-containing protein [Metabacillus sediminilitoris]|uniref:right-handed parallel beta-helix repeat-containing protein n=1 Tax=Metabacillus sediminilitoris TaxID=2567941 RepID=UPI001D0DAE29|nr:right-handed parallel beta-helix repeat-containing protein [Metabacillus sediminilitoris]
MYIIELDRWNIKQGLPSKPYTDTDYIRADANIQGINNAIQYASANGFKHVILPRGQYALCYPREIKIVSNITFDLNGSTLKVIYDSNRKSPFDTRITTDYYKFVGNSISFENVTNAHLIGGTIIGCRDDRNFSNTVEESKVENSYGVIFQKSTSYSSIKNCVVRDYMGDNITFSSSSVRPVAVFNTGLTLNAIDYTTGQSIPSSNTLTTNYINIPTDSVFSSFLIAGAGYTRLTALNNKEVDVFFYKEDNTFIGVLKKRKIYTSISIPKAASKIRMLFANETNPSKNPNITLHFGLIPHHNIVEYNEVFNGHRGGITLGGSYNIIQHNVIRDNGKGTNSFLDSKPVFNSSTRYAVNQEDSYGDNCVIRNNVIYGSNHGILAGCYSIQIENNHIYNIDSIGINLYSLMYANIRGNVIYNCTNPFGLMNSNFENAYVNFCENSIYGGRMNINTNDLYTLNISNNIFVDVMYINMGSNNLDNLFKNNHIKFINVLGSPIIIVNNIENCYFESRTLIDVIFRVYKQNGCVFNNIKINIQTKNQVTMSESVIIDNCEYTNSILNNHISGTKDREVRVTKSEFKDSVIKVGNINTAGFSAITIIEDCKLIANTSKNLFSTDFNQPNGLIKLIRCNIEITNPNFSYLIDHDKSVTDTFTLFLKECKFKYSGGTPLNLTYYDNAIPMIKFISTDNMFNNIILPNEDPAIYVGYDTDNTFKANVTLELEGDIYTTTVDHNLNTLEPYVLCISDTFQIIQPNISIINNNSINIKHSKNTTLLVTIKKL